MDRKDTQKIALCLQVRGLAGLKLARAVELLDELVSVTQDAWPVASWGRCDGRRCYELCTRTKLFLEEIVRAAAPSYVRKLLDVDRRSVVSSSSERGGVRCDQC